MAAAEPVLHGYSARRVRIAVVGLPVPKTVLWSKNGIESRRWDLLARRLRRSGEVVGQPAVVSVRLYEVRGLRMCARTGFGQRERKQACEVAGCPFASKTRGCWQRVLAKRRSSEEKRHV